MKTDTETFHMPAGTYYVGDLCYVMHDAWDEFCDITIEGNRVLDGVFSLKNGVKFATFGTAWGDGCYYDGSGREYGVDAGLIGCIRVEDIDPSEADNVPSGNVIEFTEDFVCYRRGGVIRFGDVYIDTDPSFDEDSTNIWDDEDDFV